MTKVHWADNFQELYKKNSKHPYAIRLLALSKIQEGYAIARVKDMVNKTEKTIRSWKDTYETEGLEALLSMKSGRGRKPKVESETAVKEDIKTLSTEKKGGRIVAQDVQIMLKEKHGADYSLPGVYHLLGRLKFSWVSARSIHPKADLEAQETFKKNSPKTSKRSSQKG